MKIIITGGHVTPALAVIDELKGHEVIFVGRKYALESEQSLSLEYKEITKRRIKFINLTTGRFARLLSPKTVLSLLRVPLGLYQGFIIIKNEKPDVVLSFGSYLAVPVSTWAWLFGIPVYCHEQAIIPGIADKFIGWFAKKIFISFEQSKQYFSQPKVLITGNPIRKTVMTILKKPFEVVKNKPVIFVFGGSLGSHSINVHIKKIIKELLQKYIMIHQTGNVKQYNDFEELKKLRAQLPPELKNRYFIREHFFEDEIGYIYSLSDLVVGRAGANTFFELLILQKPAIFIPLPWSANREQQNQAQIFQKAGVGEIFSQTDSSENLLQSIEKVISNREQYKNNFKNLSTFYKEDAAKTIAKAILQK